MSLSVSGCLHLAWRYVCHHRGRTLLLALVLGVTLSLPLAVRELVNTAQQQWRARALATPLVLGARGSPLELTLGSLYFRRLDVPVIPASAVATVRETGLARSIPLQVRFQAQGAPIVGTSLEYFSFRGLSPAQGRLPARLGDCVVGARLARARGLRPGGHVMSSPEQAFDLAGVYPLKMRVTGILAETHSADDDAIFVDVKTAWLIAGIAHGHEDLVQSGDGSQLLETQQGNVVASKAVRLYAEVTDANFNSFHFHGDDASFPLTAVLVLPHDAKSQALLLGRYQDGAGPFQLVQPLAEMDSLLATLIQAERFALLLFFALGVGVLLVVLLVFALSFRLRRREFATLEDIGIARGTLALVKGCEMLLVGVASLAVVAAVLLLVQRLGPHLVQSVLQ